MDLIKHGRWHYVLATCNICNEIKKEIRIDQWNRLNQSWNCRICAAKEMHKLNPHVAEKTKKTNRIHGDAKNSRSKGHWLYSRWQKMRRRCKEYPTYIEKNIQVCEEWLESYMSFKSWALQNGASPELEIDRIDNFGNYCPENCRWVTHQVNCQNK